MSGIPCRDGTNRPPATPAEHAYSKATVAFGVSRDIIGAAVLAERQAREATLQLLRRFGPSHPAVYEALQLWREASTAKAKADRDVEGTTRRLQEALAAWAHEDADSWRAA